MLMSRVRWIFIGIFFIVTLISDFDLGPRINPVMPILSVLSLFIASSLHGIARYGKKNLLIFLLITWAISHFFEAFSIQFGFPFGHYHYEKLEGPRLFEVPLIIMLGYFGMAYLSWVLSIILLRQYDQKLEKSKIFYAPLIGTFIMVMWDLGMDPPSSTISSLWVWNDGGAYFGVPLQNYFGWFFVVYLIFQTFALYISKYDVLESSRQEMIPNKRYWNEAVTLYGIQGILQFLSPFTMSDHPEIYGPMALVTFFTMIFVTLLSYVTTFSDFSRK